MASLIKRGSTFYLQHYVAGTLKCVGLNTDSLQVAKEKSYGSLNRAKACGLDNIFLTIGINWGVSWAQAKLLP